MREHMKLLGLPVRDAVTGYEGVVTTVSFDLYGCVQAVVTPAAGEKGTLPDARWFDTKRLQATAETPVMDVPTFEAPPGPQEKPAFSVLPTR